MLICIFGIIETIEPRSKETVVNCELGLYHLKDYKVCKVFNVILLLPDRFILHSHRRRVHIETHRIGYIF